MRMLRRRLLGERGERGASSSNRGSNRGKGMGAVEVVMEVEVLVRMGGQEEGWGGWGARGGGIVMGDQRIRRDCEDVTGVCLFDSV